MQRANDRVSDVRAAFRWPVKLPGWSMRLPQAMEAFAKCVRRAGLFGLMLMATGASGQSDAVYVPEALDDWRDWALHGREYRRCPLLYDSGADERADFFCAWPGVLQVTANSSTGAFEQRWTVYGDQWVPLPGNAEIWPRQVTRNGQPIEVVLRQNVPTVRLGSGEHDLAGRFAWHERPATLPVSDKVGLVALTVDGQRVAMPRREDGVWLATGDTARKVRDALTVHVYRRVLDDVPTRLETVFLLDVSGSVREERFAPALPDGFVPLAMNGDLPARLAADGELRVQVRPGSWQLAALARAATALDGITMPSPEHNMPGTEIWSYQANPTLRATVPEGERPVDPELAGAHWPRLPAFRLQGGDRLAIDERRRGQASATNDLALQRQLWLDFDGGGFTFADDITGAMRADWRLDMVAPYTLLAANDGGQDLLVTRNDAMTESTGVEVRSRDMALQALGRIESRASVPVVGWRSNMDVGATLNLPPGSRLLAAFGVDSAPGSWVGKWRLLDFFVLLIVAVATYRLFGRAMALAALLALTLSYHEAIAPVWTWLNLLAAVALARVAPAGRLQRLARSYRLASFAVLLLFLIPFAITQIRIAVYPQLAPESHRQAQTIGLFEALAGRGAVGEAAPEPDEAVVGSYIRRGDFPAAHAPDRQMGLAGAAERRLKQVAGAAGELTTTGEMLVTANVYPRYDHEALTQTGPGKPAWQWTPYELAWQGPVAMDRDMRLLIAPAWLTGLLRLLAVAALGVFAAQFALEIFARSWRWPVWRRGAPATLALVFAIALAGDPASAETPPQAILDELQERLLAPPPCAPDCAEIVAAEVRVDADEVAMRLQVHALDRVAVPLPGAVDGWRPAQVTAAGTALPVRRHGDTLWIQVDAGRHDLMVRGPLPDAETVEIPFAASPRAIEAASTLWFVDGIRDGTLPSGSLSLTRLRQEAEQASMDWQASRFPAFVTVERTLYLQPLDWRVQTVVHRVAPALGAIALDVSLLAGEAVVSDEIEVRDGRVQLALSPAQETVRWHSSLSRQASLALEAPSDSPWQEIWRLAVSSAWQATFDGVPPSQPQTSTGDAVLVFHPRPGETLALTIARPTAVPGATLAFDEAKLETTDGMRQRESVLRLAYRSTRGASHEIQLPENAELASVTTDGVAEPLALHDGVLDVPILPGEHRMTIAWREATETGLRVRTPAVDLGTAASNIVTALQMPPRWLLFVNGPRLGPAVLYWSELIALVIASLILGRVGFTPLRAYHWLLLGLGFSTFSWFAFAIVAGWLLAHGTRELWSKGLSRLVYNLSQIGFGLLTLLAFAAILAGIPSGLLGNPDMSVTGFGSTGEHLLWFADKTDGAMPQATVWSLPLWTYKALILAWALWLSFALVRWLPWIWQCFAARGLWIEKTQASAPEEPATGAA